MEDLLKKLKAYSRLLELEDSISYWQSQIPELTHRLEEMKRNLHQKELECLQLKAPNFFQRMFGKAEEKKERLSRQIREITAARTAAQWDLDGLRKKIEAGEQEVRDLTGSRDAYLTAKREEKLTVAQESQLMMEEIAAFTPVALETAWHVLEALEEARPWMQRDALSNRVGEDNRRMECLAEAAAGAIRLREILAALPEGIADTGNYLQAPNAYICGVTSEFKQLDRLEMAQEQIRNIRNKLKLLIGE